MYPIYLITCTHPNYGQYVMPYVGVVLAEGKTIEERFEEHARKSRGRRYRLSNAINKYGKEWFQVEQIDAGNTPEQAKELERWWIKRLGTKSPNGYNLTDGGDGNLGWVPSEETRRRIGIKQVGRVKTAEEIQKAADANRGMKRHANDPGKAAEFSRKQSEAAKAQTPPMLGRNHTDDTKAKMRDASAARVRGSNGRWQ